MTKSITLDNLGLIPKSMHWGYDGGGMACGPVEGSTVTEITFLDGEGLLVFISVSRLMEFANIYISRSPLYDILFHLGDSDVDFESEMELLEELAIDQKSIEMPDFEAVEKSEFRDEIYLTLMANDHHYNNDSDPGDPQEWLDDFRFGKNKKLEWESEFLREDDDEEVEE